MIDSLSFEIYQPETAWVAYRQYCQHFLAPLALISYCDIALGRLAQLFIDGISLPLASKLLPWRTKFNLQLYLHLHLHARSQIKYADKLDVVRSQPQKISRNSLLGMLDGLKSAITRLKWGSGGTEWGNYYQATNYSAKSMDSKQVLVANFVSRRSPKTVWDLGANTGVFSRIAADAGAQVVAFDIDPAAVEKNYLQLKNGQVKDILPLQLDLTNPSSSIGWASQERDSFIERGPVDMILALALVHHLALSNNLPLEKIAELLSTLCRWLVIEFVPKTDSQVQKLLSSRADIFPNYTFEGFEKAFKLFFTIEDRQAVDGSERVIFLMRSERTRRT